MAPALKSDSPPATGGPPSVTQSPALRMTTEQLALFLNEVHGLPVKPKTIQNWRAAGQGPKPVYFGNLPLYERDETERWLAEEAFQPKSTFSRRHRHRAHVSDRQLE